MSNEDNTAQLSDLAHDILRRHDNREPEANITSAVRRFLTDTGLVRDEDIQEENPPAQGSRQAVDLRALDTFIEFKRRIGPSGIMPNPAFVEQLDEYLQQSASQGRGVRMGILTDGKHWVLRWPGAGAVRTTRPYAFILESPENGPDLFKWLRDEALAATQQTEPDRQSIQARFGPDSLLYQRDIDTLRQLYQATADSETIAVKRRLWHNLLMAALGEIARGRKQMDDLFVRHTYLSMTIGMVVQASFGIDIAEVAESEPSALLNGRRFHNATGLHGIVESDFFAWPTEVEGGLSLVKTLARRVARFVWSNAPADVGAILYETVIPPNERRQLGEYYTPDWLARVMVRELVADPLNQRVLDPACGSGTFIVEAVAHFLEAAQQAELTPTAVIENLRLAVTGIDVHPVAVHLARAAWTLAARPAIMSAADAGYSSPISVPVYLGDTLQLRYHTGDLVAKSEVRVEVEDERNTTLVFPVSLVARGETFDPLMSDIANAIEQDTDPLIALDDNDISDPAERETLEKTIAIMQRLHAAGRDHIWAYYTRNLVRPVVLSREKVDVIIGNPPWLTFNRTVRTLRTALEDQSKDRYGIWVGGKHAANQDVAGLFFTRCVDLYLRDGGVIGMVMPHSALQSGQYEKWRTGLWRSKRKGRGRKRTPEFTVSVEFDYKPAWDLERLEPNSFFPVPSCVVFALSNGNSGVANALRGSVEQWRGKAGAPRIQRTEIPIASVSAREESPYAAHSRRGADIWPRCLYLVDEIENPATLQTGQTVTVNPRRGTNDKAPWRNVDLSELMGQTIESDHLFPVHLGETVTPYVALEPRKAMLPIHRDERVLPEDLEGIGGVRIGELERRMRERWSTMSRLWEENKTAASKFNLLGRLNYHRELSAQLDWWQDSGKRPFRIVYGKAGVPTAALVEDQEALVDTTLYWITCKSEQEASYLLAIINSDALYEAVKPLMPKGQFGARDLHKHLWKLRIPEFDTGTSFHGDIANVGQAAATGAAQQLAELRASRPRFNVKLARRELRAWLRTSPEGRAVEDVIARLLEK
ncbi:MAG: N-6 DNA methylase [Chloroflexota bacterium]|nr:N-6 DNA methylase [Chloroflexota bacterium]MDE2839345.1 N-6 DNA methylase [Chloroflexota bacterium]MDE2932128.1 N-6 DNA methylase [Chloroflexota bacterium]